jgi:hypothetical protein
MGLPQFQPGMESRIEAWDLFASASMFSRSDDFNLMVMNGEMIYEPFG